MSTVNSRGRVGYWTLWAGLVAVLILPKLMVGWHMGPIHGGDERVWAIVGKHSLRSSEFWHGIRPFVVPLIHKSLGFDEQWVVRFQSAFACASWILLTYAFSLFLPQGLTRSLLGPLLLLLPNASSVDPWDWTVRSESVTISLSMASIAGALMFARAVALGSTRMLRVSLIGVLASSFLAAFARDTSAYFVLALAAFSVGLWLLHRKPSQQPSPTAELEGRKALSRTPGWHCAILVGALLTIVALAQHNLRTAERYRGPLMNVIFQRVLPSRVRLEYFRDELGMPVSTALRSRQRKWHSSQGFLVFKAPEYEDFRQWLSSRGYTSYQRFLISHLPESCSEAAAALPRILGREYRGDKERLWTRLADAVTQPVSKRPAETGIFLLLVALATVPTRQRNWQALALLSIFLMLTALGLAFVTYHGDAMEIERHGIMTLVLAQLGFCCAVLLTACLAFHLVRRSLDGIRGSARRQNVTSGV